MNLGDVDREVGAEDDRWSPRPAPAARSRPAASSRTACHASIGVLAAVTVATACLQPGSPAAALAALPQDGRFLIEHPTGAAEVLLDLAADGTLKRRRHRPHRPQALRRPRLPRACPLMAPADPRTMRMLHRTKFAA